jgi:hypothetical protein
MARRIWTGATNGNFGTAGNWSPATAPVSNDEAMFDASSTVNVDAGLDQSAVDLDALIVAKGCKINIGTSASPLIISADKVLHEGDGTLYYKDGNGTTDLVIIKGTLQEGAGAAVLDGSSITRLVVAKGLVTIKGTAGSIGTLTIAWIDNVANDAKVVLETRSASQSITTLRMSGGSLDSDWEIAALYLTEGRVFHDSAAGNAIQNIYQLGGSVQYQSSGTIGLAELVAGVLDASKSSAATTITDLIVFPGARAIVPEDYAITTPIILRDDGLIRG